MSQRLSRASIVLPVVLAGLLAMLWLGSRSRPPARHAGGERPFAEATALDGPSGLNKGKLDEETSGISSFSTDKPAADAASEQSALLESLRARLEQPQMVHGEALLSFFSKDALDRFTRQAASRGMEILGTIPQLNTARVRYGTLEGLRDLLVTDGSGYSGVEGNLWLSVPQPPPEPDASNQGGAAPFGQGTMSAINASGDRTHWGDSVTVAVLDTGVQAHPTFGENQVTHLDLVNDGQVFDSHGTSVASLIGGQDSQAPGVAPGAKLLDIRVAGVDGYTVGSVLAQGIITATDRRAQVINISFGGYGDSALLSQAVDYAYQRGAVVVAAAGNEALDQLTIPAAYDRVISVGSVDAKSRQAYFSNSGQGLDLVAPGVGVVTAWSTNQVAFVSGTSQSSALVAAAAAAYVGWGIAPAGVAARLKADSRPTGSPANQVGAGILMIKPPAGR